MRLTFALFLVSAFSVASLSMPLTAQGVPPDRWAQDRILRGETTNFGVDFGHAMGLSGDTLIVGARSDGGSDLLGDATGSAFLFERNLGAIGGWGQRAKLTASDAQAGDRFGFSVALDGDTAVVGAPSAKAGEGAVYIFERNLGGSNNWGERKRLVASHPFNDDFGAAVAISGDTIIVGAPRTNLGVLSGVVYVFERHLGGSDSWGERTQFPEGTSFAFGRALALDGDTAVACSRGRAHVFERDLGGADNWAKRTTMVMSGPLHENFCWSVALSGDHTVLGGIEAPDHGHDAGIAYIFERNLGGADSWGQRARFSSSDPQAFDLFGWSVDIHDDVVVVGAIGMNGLGPFRPGSATVFERNLGGIDNWGERAELFPTDAMSIPSEFGAAVATDGATVIVGDNKGDVDDDLDFGEERGIVFVFVERLFSDDFENGDCSAWSGVVGSCSN